MYNYLCSGNENQPEIHAKILSELFIISLCELRLNIKFIRNAEMDRNIYMFIGYRNISLKGFANIDYP